MLKTNLEVPIIVPKDLSVDLHIQALVGYDNAQQFHVFEVTRPLVKFSMYKKVEISEIEEPKSYVSFLLNERAPRVGSILSLFKLVLSYIVYFKINLWLSNNFLFTDELLLDSNVEIAFVALRTERPLVIKMDLNGQFTIKTDDIELAGEIIQSLALYLNLSDLQVTCDFPDELENLKQALINVSLSLKQSIR